jgi:hypothetical protein
VTNRAARIASSAGSGQVSGQLLVSAGGASMVAGCGWRIAACRLPIAWCWFAGCWLVLQRACSLLSTCTRRGGLRRGIRGLRWGIQGAPPGPTRAHKCLRHQLLERADSTRCSMQAGRSATRPSIHQRTDVKCPAACTNWSVQATPACKRAAATCARTCKRTYISPMRTAGAILPGHLPGRAPPPVPQRRLRGALPAQGPAGPRDPLPVQPGCTPGRPPASSPGLREGLPRRPRAPGQDLHDEAPPCGAGDAEGAAGDRLRCSRRCKSATAGECPVLQCRASSTLSCAAGAASACSCAEAREHA